jgi:hypothetical protein
MAAKIIPDTSPKMRIEGFPPLRSQSPPLGLPRKRRTKAPSKTKGTPRAAAGGGEAWMKVAIVELKPPKSIYSIQKIICSAQKIISL